MKKYQKKLCILFAVLLLAALWCWRYYSLNAYYHGLYEEKKEVYSMGDAVPFGKDKTTGNAQAEGYAVTVDSFQVLESDTFFETYQVSKDAFYSSAERIAVVTLKLSNEESSAPGISLLDFRLHGLDNYAMISPSLLMGANPDLQKSRSTGISLSANTEYTVVLPFELFRRYVAEDTWKNMDRYTWYLHVTSYPTEKDIVLK